MAFLLANTYLSVVKINACGNKYINNDILKQFSVNKAFVQDVRSCSRTRKGSRSPLVCAAKQAVYHTLGGNSWKMELPASNTTVLCDPWLSGSLTFFSQAWLYQAQKETPGLEVAKGADILLLSQGLEDHAHPPTLARLPKSLRVVASPSAAEVVRKMGFTSVTVLPPGKGIRIGSLEITATKGALVGPPWSERENGFVLREKVEDGISWYYEPHCDFDERSLRSVGTVDLVISPAAEIKLGGYALVHGIEDTVKLLKILQPKVMLPLQNGAVNQEGPLAPFITAEGTLESLERDIKKSNIDVTIVTPPSIGKHVIVNIA